MSHLLFLCVCCAELLNPYSTGGGKKKKRKSKRVEQVRCTAVGFARIVLIGLCQGNWCVLNTEFITFPTIPSSEGLVPQ